MSPTHQPLGALLGGLVLLVLTSLPQSLECQAKVIEIHTDENGEFSHTSIAKPPKSVVVERGAEIPKPNQEPRTIRGDSVAKAVRQHSGRLTMVVVWASWCGSCRKSISAVTKVARKYRQKGLSVVTFSVDESQVEFERHAEKFRGEVLLYLIRPGDQSEIGREMAELGVVLPSDYQGEIPLFVFLDQKGEHIVSIVGGPSYRDLNKVVGFLLKGPGKFRSSLTKLRKKKRRG